jgi:hypothetical protein
VEGSKLGGVVLRASFNDGFVLADLQTDLLVERNLPSLQAAVEAARRLGVTEIWQQNVDNRGRPLGDPFKLLPLAR